MMDSNIKRPTGVPGRTPNQASNRVPNRTANQAPYRVPTQFPNRAPDGKSTSEEDRWERDPYPVARKGWSAYKILIVTLLLLAVALGVNYWLRTQGFPVLQNWFENVSEGWDEEDEMTEDDLSIDWDIDWDNAPRVLDEEESVDELMDEPVDEETDNTEEDLALPIYEEVE